MKPAGPIPALLVLIILKPLSNIQKKRTKLEINKQE